MIDQYELNSFLNKELPGFSKECKPGLTANPYQAMQAVLKLTAVKVGEHQLGEVRRYFEIVDFLYEKGNGAIKNAVENIYVYSLSTVLFASGDRNRILSIIPISLYTVYINQLKSCGC